MNYFKKNLLEPAFLGFSYASFAEYLDRLHIKRDELSSICGVTPRTIRRYINENNAPPWVYLVALCAAGYLLSEDWQGWRIHNHGLVHRDSNLCKHDSIKPQMLIDMTFHFGYKRALELQLNTLELKLNDLTRENDFMRNKLAIVDHKRMVPKNVVPFNRSVTYEQISKQLQG